MAGHHRLRRSLRCQAIPCLIGRCGSRGRGWLGFLPLPDIECFDLVRRRRERFLPPMQALWAFARTPAFAHHAARLGGDDIAPPGQVRWTV